MCHLKQNEIHMKTPRNPRMAKPKPFQRPPHSFLSQSLLQLTTLILFKQFGSNTWPSCNQQIVSSLCTRGPIEMPQTNSRFSFFFVWQPTSKKQNPSFYSFFLKQFANPWLNILLAFYNPRERSLCRSKHAVLPSNRVTVALQVG